MSDDPVQEPRLLATSLQTPQQRSERVKFRRALAFLGMTLVLPGSAQLTAGNRRVGRLALRVWAGLWVLLLAFGVFALIWRSGAVAVVTAPLALRIVQVALLVVAAGWAGLLLDAWRLARPVELARRHRIGFATLNLALVLSVVAGLVASASIVSAQRDLVSTVFAGGGDTKAKAGRYNILLMGGDAGKGRTGLRPDSLTVASVDAATGRTVLISLPRNLEDVPFPPSSPLHKKFPKGYGCADHSCMLNAVYTYATNHKNLYPGVADPGAKATAEAVEGATGLKINYYVLVDLKGFQALVDAVGGITLDVHKRVPIGGETSPIYGWIETGHNVHLDGFHALWFARSRADSSDYERMARQKCVMNAMLNQLEPVTVLTKFNKIATAGKEIVATNIPPHVINSLLELAEKARSKPVSSVAFVPPLIYPGDPNFTKISRVVAAKVAASEAKDAPALEPAASTSASPGAAKKQQKKKKPATSSGTANRTNNLSSVCSARP